jgi:hypothetical protein
LLASFEQLTQSALGLATVRGYVVVASFLSFMSRELAQNDFHSVLELPIGGREIVRTS